jgi:hypothetical protein
VKGRADKKVMVKDVLVPMAKESGEIVSSKPKVIDMMGFALALISFRKGKRFRRDLEGEGSSGVGRNASIG